MNKLSKIQKVLLIVIAVIFVFLAVIVFPMVDISRIIKTILGFSLLVIVILSIHSKYMSLIFKLAFGAWRGVYRNIYGLNQDHNSFQVNFPTDLDKPVKWKEVVLIVLCGTLFLVILGYLTYFFKTV